MLGFFVGSILLASGVSFYPQAYQWIYDNVPFLYIYREPWSKFLPYVIFSMAGLVTFSLDKIKNKLHLFIIAFVIIFRMYPFLSPSLFDYTNLGWKKLFLKPPQAWQQFDDWSLNYKDSYILPFPISTPTTQIIYRWYDGQLGNSNLPLYLHFGSTNTFSTAYAPNSYVKQILYSFFEIESMNFIKLMTVDYMLEQRDAVDFDRLDNFTYQPGARKFFEKKPFKVFDESLHLYKILPEYKLELIYVPNSISVISADISNLPDYVTDSFVVGDALYLKEQNENILDIKYKKPLVSYEKVNPTKYAVDINGAKGTFPIVFNQAYNRYWSLDGIESAHLIANGYANSWFIDTKEYCSKPSNCIVNEDGSYDFDLTLSYYPQKVYNVLFVIIFGLFLSNSGYLFVRLFVRKSKQ